MRKIIAIPFYAISVLLVAIAFTLGYTAFLIEGLE